VDEAPGPFGQHRVDVDGELVTLRFVGAASLAETKAFHELLARLLAERGRCYVIVDLRGLTGMGAEVRRFIGEWNREHQITAGAAFGAGFSIRVVVTLLLSAIRLMSKDPPEIHMCQGETEARRYIAACQAARAPQA
jgi:hypothetical protein